MSVGRNKELARKAIGTWNSGDLGAADEIYAPGYVNHQHSRPAAKGPRGVWTDIAIDRIAGGKIVEGWARRDMPGMLQQPGAVSWPGSAPASRT